MKSYLPEFHLTKATSLKHALDIISTSTITPIAGGTDIMVLLDAGKLPPGNFLDINSIDSLKNITEDGDYIYIGALNTFTDIRENNLCQQYFPMMCEAGRWSGARAIQNRGTIGGNICNASPAGDTPPALLCYDAEIELSCVDGTRWINYHEFHLDYKKLEKKPHELLTQIRIKKTNPNRFELYQKVGTRLAQAISKICFAGLIEFDADKRVKKVRLSWGAMGPYVLRSFKVEDFICGNKIDDALIESSVKKLGQELSPIGDIRSSADYRKRVAMNLLKHFLITSKGH